MAYIATIEVYGLIDLGTVIRNSLSSAVDQSSNSQIKSNLLKAEGPMVTNTAKSNITYTEIKTKRYKLWEKNKNLRKKHN